MTVRPDDDDKDDSLVLGDIELTIVLDDICTCLTVNKNSVVSQINAQRSANVLSSTRIDCREITKANRVEGTQPANS